jgi:ferric-dicitrate binding protein FerR (iron transport regulator)
MKAITAGCILAFVVLGLIAWGIGWAIMDLGNTAIEQRRTAYAAWSRMNPQHQLTFEQWVALSNEYLLPGQQRPTEHGASYPIYTPIPLNP